MTNNASKAERWTKSFLYEPEKRLLIWMCSKTPSWVTPDQLTLLAIFSSILIGAAYTLSTYGNGWLWIASLGLILHWYGDSMDGTLARCRRIQRPRYGFYVDHLADAFSTVFIGIGLGLSPYMLLAVGLSIIIMYLILSLNVYLETITRESFRLGYGIIGPTEARILLIVLNTVAVIIGPIRFNVAHLAPTIFDVIGAGAVLGMIAMANRRIRRNLRILGEEEPPNVVKEG